MPGVRSAVSGFVGGHTANPTYGAGGGGTSCGEAVQVTFDPRVVSYRTLVDRLLAHNRPDRSERSVLRTRAVLSIRRLCDSVPARGRRRLARCGRACVEEKLHHAGSRSSGVGPAGEEHQNYAKRHAASYQAYQTMLPPRTPASGSGATPPSVDRRRRAQ